METEVTKDPILPSIKSGKIESELKFSPTKESKSQVQTKTSHNNIGWHTHHESQPQVNHNVVPPSKKNKKKEKEDCALF